MSSGRRRTSKKESYWRELVAKWRASSLSQAEFSRQAGISVKALGYWKRRIKREGDHIQLDTRGDRGLQDRDRASPSAIVAVPLAQPVEPSVPHRPIIIHAGGGFRLEIAGDFHPTVLEKILRTLERLA